MTCISSSCHITLTGTLASEQWQGIPQGYIRRLLLSMRNRFTECINKGCGHYIYGRWTFICFSPNKTIELELELYKILTYNKFVITYSCLCLFSTKRVNWDTVSFSMSIKVVVEQTLRSATQNKHILEHAHK